MMSGPGSSMADDVLIEKIRELEASERRMAALLELGPRFMAERDPDALLADVCTAAREMTQAAIAGVGLVSEDFDRLEHVVTVGLERRLTERMRPSLTGSGRLRQVLEKRQPMRGVNPEGDPAAFRLPGDHPPFHSYLLAPLASPGRVYGWFALIGKTGADGFSDIDERIAMTLGAQVGMAYENASLLRQLVAQTKALRDNEDDMEFAMSVARVGLSYRELDAGDIVLSRSLAAMLELPPGTRSIAREAFLARVHPDDVASVRSAVEHAVSQQSQFELEYRLHTRSGGWRWMRSNGRVVSNRQDQKPRLFSGITDVTERRTLEMQLHHAQKMDAIGQLAGGVAHDFNNLLTAIMGHAGLLQESVTDARHRGDVAEILKAADRAAALTKRLLAFGRRQVVEAVPLDLNALVQDMVEMLRRLIGEHIQLTTTLEPELPFVRADRSHLEQLLMNLVVNARDAIDGSGAIRIHTTLTMLEDAQASGRAVEPGPYVTLCVTDDGAGMTEEVKSRIFEPFFTTKTRKGGTGLGLATVYGIVAQSRGSIAVSSEPGRGATFTVYLPAQPRTAVAAVPPDESHQARPGHETVLLAEDEDSVRALARVILVRAGYTVVEAASPAEAAAKAESMAHIDLLLTDVVMPGGTGPDLFRHLSATRPELRVLFMSGYAERRLFDSADVDQEEVFMEKPFSAAALMHRVREVLDR